MGGGGSATGLRVSQIDIAQENFLENITERHVDTRLFKVSSTMVTVYH